MNEHGATIIEFPVDVFTRWRRRHPLEAAVDSDPRAAWICGKCGQTFAWRGYEPLCGWCHEADEA